MVEMSSNEDGNEQKFDNTADQHRCWSSLLSVSTEMFTYLPIRCDVSLCDYLYTILSHHSTCEDPFWKSPF